MTRISSIGAVFGSAKANNTDLSSALTARTKFARTSRMAWDVGPRVTYDPSSTSGVARKAHAGRVDSRLTVEGPLYTEGLEFALLSAAGDVATSGGGDPFTHKFKYAAAVAANKAYLSGEMPFGQAADALAANMACRRFEARFGAGEVATYQAQFLTGKPSIVAKTSPTLTTTPAVPGHHATVLTLDAISSFFVESGSWFIDHNNHEDEYDGNTRTRKGAAYREYVAGFEATVLYDDVDGKDVLERLLDANNATAPSETRTEGPTYAASIKTTAQSSAPERSVKWDSGAVFLEAGTPEPAGRDLMRQRITGRAVDDGTIAGAEVVVLNSVSAV